MHPTAPASGAPAPARVSMTPILVAAGALGAGVGLVFPLLAEFQDRYGFSALGLGLISGASFLTALVAGLGLARLADRGHARALMVAGLVAAAAALFWFARATELWQFVAARSLEGLGAGVYLPAARKIATAGDPRQGGRRLGMLASAEVGGFLSGPVLGAGLTALVGLWLPFVAVGAVTLAMAVWIARARLPAVPVDEAPRSPLASVAMLARPPVAAAALLGLAAFLPVGLYDALWSRYLTDRGAGTVLIGVGLTLYSLPVVLLSPRGGRIADRVGPVRAAAVALVLLAAITALYGVVPWPYVITALALLEGFPGAVANPSVQAAMLRACGPGEVAAGQGLSNAVSQVGAASMALLAPVVYAAAGPVVVFTGVSVLVLAALGGALALHARGRAAGEGDVPVSRPPRPLLH